MKSSLSFLFLFLFCLSANGQSVGINTTNPDPSAALDVQSFDQGILVPRLKTNARMGIMNPATGLLVFDVDLNRFYCYNGSKWMGLSTTDAFVNEFGLVRNDGDLGNDIFLFAQDQIPSGISDDTLMMFHTPSGSFRAGKAGSDFWVVDSLGNFSFAAGAGVKASGNYSASVGTGNQSIGEASFTAGFGNDATDSYATAIGRMNDATGFGSLATGSENLASGQYATAMGNFTEASGSNATAMGSQTRAVGGQSIAMGIQSEAIGNYSTAMGRTTKAESRTSTVMGRFNVGGGHPSIWQDPDPLLEVGNGSDAANLHNAFTVLKGGKTGIGTATPDTNFSVIGVSRAAFDESETDFIEMSHGGGNAFINAAGAGNIDIRHEGTNIMTIAQNQRVGIGTNSPDTDLSVIGKVRAAIQSNENEYTEIFHGGDNGYINTVGDGDLQFRHDDDTKMYLTDAGDLYVDGAVIAGNPTSPPVEGMIRYDHTTSIIQFHDGNVWSSIGAFSNNGGVVKNTGSNDDDFVFGRESLPENGSTHTEDLFFFDESKGSFRSGGIQNSINWNGNSIGTYSVAFGLNSLASGDYSLAAGDRPKATGERSISLGSEGIRDYINVAPFPSIDAPFASGKNSVAIGAGATATGDFSVALGLDARASGIGAVGMGDTNADCFRCVSVGQYNVGGADPNDWVLTDPVFEVGIGSLSTPKNALTVLKNGNVGINIWNPIHPLHVGTDPTNGNGAYLTVGGTWTNSSSRTFKDHFESIEPKTVLANLAKIEVLKWKYKGSEEGYHLGPMAEDFYEAFGLGSDEKYISSVDADGVSMAAIQGLYQENQALKTELNTQKMEIEKLKALMKEILKKTSEE